MRVTGAVSTLTYAFEEGQPIALCESSRASKAFGLECSDRATRVVGIDRRGARGFHQCTQASTRRPLDDDDPAARYESAERLLQGRDPLLGPHARQQPLLIVEHNQVERSVFERKIVQMAGLDLKERACFFGASSRARGIGFGRYDRARTAAQPDFGAECAKQRGVSAPDIQQSIAKLDAGHRD
jgi:hypothetical protein